MRDADYRGWEDHGKLSLTGEPVSHKGRWYLGLPDVMHVIGEEAWSGISWVICHGWIAGYKQQWSQNGDIGVPETVAKLSSWSPLSEEVSDKIHSRVRQDQLADVRWFLTIGYLLGTNWSGNNQHYDHVDEHGEDQLVGELKRYWARKRGEDPHQVTLVPALVAEYCLEHRLDEQTPMGMEKSSILLTEKLFPK